MMWFFLLLYVAHIVPAISQGDGNKVILKDGGDPCEGHAEVFHNGQWGYVGDTYWNRTTEETVCRSTDCGKPVSSQDVLRSMESKPVWLNEIVCKDNSDDLTKCDHPGWNSSYYPKDSVKKIKCSKRVTIGFLQSPFRCAGAVMYSSSEGNKGYFCGNLAKAANLLCQSLGCGQSKEVLQDEWMVLKDVRDLEKKSINCLGIQNLDNLWQCTSPETSCTKPVSVICTGHKRLQVKGKMKNVCSGRLEIEEDSKWNRVKKLTDMMSSSDLCKQIHCGEKKNLTQDDEGIKLTCKKKVEVVLMDKTISNCYGEVHLKVDGEPKPKPVCGSSWSKEDAEMVCKELNCGGVLHYESKRLNTQGIMDNVKCSGKESSLWHCMAKRSDHNTFSCSSSAYVVCKNSINVRLADGPGKCAGRVELLYEGQWQGVTDQGWTETNADAVCTHLNCGNKTKTAKPEKFSQGSGSSLELSCKSSASGISDCDITKKKNQNFERGEEEAVGITCERHKVVFLKENACSGKVGIERGNKTYWLSGSNKTWNKVSADTVCRQMHCGKAVTHTFIPSADMMKDVWHESYNCLSNSTSLFECEKTTLPSDNNTVASVTCSGGISVNLTKDCWGYVNFCAGRECGGVCKASWTDHMSQMLCANLGCGKEMNSVKHIHNPEDSNVIFKSLHMTEHTTKLSQCNFVKNEDRVTCEKAYVLCTGSVRANFNVSSSRSKCSGNVEIQYEDKWLPVCKDALNNNKIQNIICRELNCGQPLKLDDYFGPRAAAPSVISKIECTNDSIPLKACSISPGTSSCPLGHLQCSSWSHMDLKFGNACRGAVFVHSEGNRSAVSSEGWTETASKQLCKDLKCGELKSNRTKATTNSLWHRNFNCDGEKTPQNIWDCEKETSLTKPVTSAQQVFIECQGNAHVTLSETCHGEVKINNITVCHNNWKPEYSDLVCQEKQCGNAVTHANDSGFFESKALLQDVQYSYNVNCEKYHHNLGQCNRYEAKCKDVVVVYCSNAVNFSTTEKCGGRIKVYYGKTTDYFCPPAQFSSDMKNKLCDELGCKAHNDSIKEDKPKFKRSMNVQLHCTEDHKDIKRCITVKKCEANPAQIYCEGYENRTVVIRDQPPNRTVPIILGLGFLLIVVILIIVFIRIRMVRRAKRPMNVSSRMLPRNEVESESGEYEPVTNKENEMDVFSNGRFRSEAEVVIEGDLRSTSSYDDVDEAAESQPLTSPAVPAGASGDSFFGDGGLNQSSDGVTYEVEDPQESYDDIEASPEFIQTKAEVHDVPEPAPESVTVATPGMVQGEEDYLVPGQDR